MSQSQLLGFGGHFRRSSCGAVKKCPGVTITALDAQFLANSFATSGNLLPEISLMPKGRQQRRHRDGETMSGKFHENCNAITGSFLSGIFLPPKGREQCRQWDVPLLIFYFYKLTYNTAMGYWEKPSFYIRASFFIVLVLISFSFIRKSKTYYFKENVFDKSQYLFPEAKKTSSSNALSLKISEGVYFNAYNPPFLISGKVFGDVYNNSKEKLAISRYVVQKGDTLLGLSKKFNISVKTILWANNLTYSSRLNPGKKLVILPVSGVLHMVNPGETLSGIAALHKAKVSDIVEANGISGSKIYAGDILIIPNGVKAARMAIYKYIPVPNSYFICPIAAPCRITQGLHWYNAVDFSNGKCGGPIFAAAGGVVQKTSYNSVAGYYVKIMHPNKVVTFYGHMSKIAVSPGQKVYQGQIIGYIGHTGHTIPAGPRGCHVHFSVRFAKNPFAVYRAGTVLGK